MIKKIKYKFLKMFCYSLFLILILLFIGPASASDYYVSTAGNNASDGLTIDTAWANLSYATMQVDAGDTIYVMPGTYYQEYMFFANNGTEENKIIVKSYSEMAILDGILPTQNGPIAFTFDNHEYITIQNLKITNYTSATNPMNCNNITMLDLDVSFSYASALILAGPNAHYMTIHNSTIHNSGWNGISLGGYVDSVATHLTISNNTIYNNYIHGGIDIFGYADHLVIENNTIRDSPSTAIYTHSQTDMSTNITINNNIIYNVTNGMKIENMHDSIISNNWIYDINGTSRFGIYLSYDSENVTLLNNNISTAWASSSYPISSVNSNVTMIGNSLPDKNMYSISQTSNNPITDTPNNVYAVWMGKVNLTINYTDNTVFTISRNTQTGNTVSDIIYTPANSEINVNGTVIVTVQKYNFTVTPDTGSLQVTSLNENLNLDTYSITIDSSVVENPTWITIPVANMSSNYNITKDGVFLSVVNSGTDSIVRYYYNIAGNEWDAEHTFAIEETSSDSGGFPSITGFFPTDTTPAQTNGSTNEFNVTVNQALSSSEWYLDGDSIASDTLSLDHTWTHASTHNITFIGSNDNGSVSKTWTVEVTDESQSSSSSVAITPATQTVARNQPFTLTIPITPATPIAGAQFDLLYDGSMATVTSVTEGNLLSQDGATTLFNSGTIDNAAGTITNIYGSILGATSVSLQGSLATISMTAGSATGYLNLDLSNVVISDADSNPATYTLTNATVLIDTAPVLTQIGAKSVDEGSALALTLSATDADGDSLTYTATNLPVGASFNTATGAFSWTPADGEAGTYVVTFEVTDGYIGDSEAVTITVNDGNNAPVITTFVPANSLTFNELDVITVGIIASDADGDALTYTIKIDGVTKSTSSSYVWETDYSSAGTHTIDITVSDGIEQVTDQRTITINDIHPRWDVNEDGTVNVLDISIIGQKYGSSVGAPYPRWDVNQDGAINVQDMTLAAYYFGETVA